MTRTLFLWFVGFAALILVGARIAAKQQDPVVRVYADSDNNVQVVTHRVTSHERLHMVPHEPGQVGIDSPKIAADGRTAGWLVLYRNPDGGTPIAGKLVLWRGGRVIRSFSSGQVFWSWSFEDDGRQAAYHTGPAHGETTSRCELRDVATGRLVASWDGDLQASTRPAWTKGLEH